MRIYELKADTGQSSPDTAVAFIAMSESLSLIGRRELSAVVGARTFELFCASNGSTR